MPCIPYSLSLLACEVVHWRLCTIIDPTREGPAIEYEILDKPFFACGHRLQRSEPLVKV
jgi:hypothetical protein